MKINRTQNAARNVFTGMILKLYQMIGPFVVRTVMIYILGMEYLGLNSLFVSVLQVLNLAELGVGSAMVYSMYKPIADDNLLEICALMGLYRKYYRIIGLIILSVGMCITPMIPRLISGEVPSDMNVFYLYWLNLGATVLSYWLFAYKNSLLTAFQRNDIIDKITIGTTTFQYVFQIIVLLFTKNYYLFVATSILSQVMLNLCTAYMVNKKYPGYKPNGKLSHSEIKRINGKVKDILTSKIGEVIVNSADTIVISAFLGLTVLAIYNNYYYILTAIMGFITLFFRATTAGIGNSLIMESEDKNYRDLRKFTFIISWIGCFCTCSLLCLYQSFMLLWVGEGYLLELSCVVCLCVYFYIRVINQLLIVYKDAAGMWHEDRFRPLVTALTNLVLNLILVHFMGIYGVLLSTVISTLFVGMPWVLKNLFSVIFQRKMKEYVFELLTYSAVTIFCCAISFELCYIFSAPLILKLIINAIICFVVPNTVYFIIFRNSQLFSDVILITDNVIGSKIPIVHKILARFQVVD